MKYKIFASQKEDIRSPVIWISNPEFVSRSIVRVTNPEKKSKIYCEVSVIDDNFIKDYNNRDTISINNDVNAIIMNEWYRKNLGIDKNKEYVLNIEKPWIAILGKIKASLYHPDAFARLASYLAILSVALGLIGILT